MESYDLLQEARYLLNEEGDIEGALYYINRAIREEKSGQNDAAFIGTLRDFRNIIPAS